MFEVKLVSVSVRRGMDTEVACCVPVHELDILHLVHGGGNVVRGEDAGVMTVETVADERERLTAKYGFNAQGLPYADAVYPGNSALEAAVRAGEVQAAAPSAPKPAAKMTKAELQALLNERGIAFAADAKADDLRALAMLPENAEDNGGEDV